LKAIILAAGEGSRMRPLTYSRPKVMLPLANQPILEHSLIQVRDSGITEFIFVIGYHSEKIREHFHTGRKWGVKIEYVTQPQQLGTADALRMVAGLVDNDFIMMNGDMITSQKDITRLMARDSNAMTLFPVSDTTGLGTVLVEKGRVSRIFEKVESSPSRLANAGLYRLTRDIFPALAETPKSARGEYEITDALQTLINRGYPVSYENIQYWLDLSYPWDLLKANESILVRLESEIQEQVEENVVIKAPVSIGRDTVVKSGSYIIGPVVIVNDCEIGPNCYIRPTTAIGDRCHIGAACEVKNSIIMNGSQIPHHNYVGDSVIGEDCNLGSGTKIANLRLDKENVVVDGRNTGCRKLGVIMGDHVETGINACINVGSLIGDNSRIGPGAVASGIIAPGSKVF
jgi:bifunctional UDP-N-acetylglucosamine pyrophosphorylase/glucosamine-1-phosphate N-acetyltransferase